MKKYIVSLALVLLTSSFTFAQEALKAINRDEVSRIENKLASDEMRGRKVFSPEIDKAADFIASEFRKTGLSTLDGSANYLQSFTMIRPKYTGGEATLDGQAFDGKKLIVITSKPDMDISEQSGYELVTIPAGASLFKEVFALMPAKKNRIVLVDESFSNDFGRLIGLKRSLMKSDFSTVLLLTNTKPSTFHIKATHEITEMPLANVVGVLPGHSKKDEIVVFSGHYDHLGVGKAVNGDSIYNGANDDAAGTTAVIMLARYFKTLNNNERTIIFVAFTGEESGGYGSQYFSKQLDPVKVMAMFNIEMIGTESKWGKNSAYITGYEKTDMGTILQQNLAGTEFTFYPDPYTSENLFYRSDNATLARLGVPAHTISTSKMDNEPNYHKVSDEISTLDMDNMAMIIRAIAKSSASIISGKSTPSRVKTEELR